MHISDLIHQLLMIRDEHGNLPVYVYSSEEKRGMPMLSESLRLSYENSKPVFGKPVAPVAITVSISAILPWVEESEIYKLRAENERLRLELQPYLTGADMGAS